MLLMKGLLSSFWFGLGRLWFNFNDMNGCPPFLSPVQVLTLTALDSSLCHHPVVYLLLQFMVLLNLHLELQLL